MDNFHIKKQKPKGKIFNCIKQEKPKFTKQMFEVLKSNNEDLNILTHELINANSNNLDDSFKINNSFSSNLSNRILCEEHFNFLHNAKKELIYIQRKGLFPDTTPIDYIKVLIKKLSSQNFNELNSNEAESGISDSTNLSLWGTDDYYNFIKGCILFGNDIIKVIFYLR